MIINSELNNQPISVSSPFPLPSKNKIWAFWTHGDSFINYLYFIFLIVMFNVVSWRPWHIFIESLTNFEINFFQKVVHFFNNFFLWKYYFLKILTFPNAKVTKVLWYVQLFRCKTIQKIHVEFGRYFVFVFYLRKNKLCILTPCDWCMFRCIIMFALHSTMDKAQRWIIFTITKVGLNYCFYLRPFYFDNATPSSFNNCEYYNT